jgi:hypothetical protein
MVATVITLIPNDRSSTRTQGLTQAPAPASAPSLRSFAVEPTGEGPYVEALREWIERVSPGSSQADSSVDEGRASTPHSRAEESQARASNLRSCGEDARAPTRRALFLVR